MGKITLAAITPHPPIVVPEVGRGEENKIEHTINSMERVAQRIKDSAADLLVVISPHGAVFSDGVAINAAPTLQGDLAQFRAAQVNLEFENDLHFVGVLLNKCKDRGVVAVAMDKDMAGGYRVSTKLDHGVIVPLYFVDKVEFKVPLVMVSMSLLPPLGLYNFGLALQEAIKDSDKNVAIIASGDLSHRLTHDAPSGYAPEGKTLDEEIVRTIREFDVEALMNLDPELAERGAECGWRSILMMLGSLDGLEVSSEVLSYEGPFGVGYMVALLTPGNESKERRLLDKLIKARQKSTNEMRANESEYVRLARETLERYILEGRKIKAPESLPEQFKEQAGVFVSIKKHGQLRGCIGTILPTTPNIAEEIINNAISAGTRDPRFDEIEDHELDELVYSVDVLKKPEPISGLEELDTKRYGVIVKNGRRSGLLLPNLEGVDAVDEQVSIARQKAGISPEEPIELERFEVVRYH